MTTPKDTAGCSNATVCSSSHWCVYCGRDFRSVEKTRDHFWPKEKRIKSKSSGPIYASCKTCNQIKGNLRFESIEAAREYIYAECKRITDNIRSLRRGERPKE